MGRKRKGKTISGKRIPIEMQNLIEKRRRQFQEGGLKKSGQDVLRDAAKQIDDIWFGSKRI